MQLAVELGLLGFLPFLIGLLIALVRVFAWTRRERILFPIMCMLGYVAIIFTVSGSDTVSASLLAIGLYFGRPGPGTPTTARTAARGLRPGPAAGMPPPVRLSAQLRKPPRGTTGTS
jgi:hypothetical protein